jgi:hypothetical protein
LQTALQDALSTAVGTADLLAFRVFSECCDDAPPIEPEDMRKRTIWLLTQSCRHCCWHI